MKNDQLEALYNKYYKELYVYALSFCKDHYLAQDLVSETFYKALFSLDDAKTYIKFWLFRVCRNLYLDYLRKNSRLQDMESHRKELFQEDGTTLDKIIKNEERKRVYSEVLKLQQSYKEITILYYYCSLTLREAASIMGISEGAARIQLFRARKRVKEGLKEEY